jgi:2-C-methyl-D-erythritol 4-phosphate cytidylyltransferase
VTTVSVIVPAAGCGARAALNGNKILAPLCGAPVLRWTLRALCAGFVSQNEATFHQLIVAARPEEFELIRPLMDEIPSSVEVALVAGGSTRQDSVHGAVQVATGDLALIHDAARPCLSAAVLARVLRRAEQTGAAMVGLPVSDTVKRADSAGNVCETLDRSTIWLAQTPQVFRRDWFEAALLHARQSGFQGTDCASLLEQVGRSVALVEGDIHNLKVTYAADLDRAAAVLSVHPSHS